MLKINAMKQVVLFALIIFYVVYFQQLQVLPKPLTKELIKNGLLLMDFGLPSLGIKKVMFLEQSKKILRLIRMVFLV